MKPILLITEIIQNIVKNGKDFSIKNIRDIPEGTYNIEYDEEEKCFSAIWSNKVPGNDSFVIGHSKLEPPFKVGEDLYVRETWTVEDVFEEDGKHYALIGYKAEEDHASGQQTKIEIKKYQVEKYKYYLYYGNEFIQSIYMPKEAARLFIKVIDLKVEKQNDSWVWKYELEKIKKIYKETYGDN